jgi:LmbE family N-acetylglucosaminyl deacetylase
MHTSTSDRILFVSPHADDIALSVGGAALLVSGIKRILTVFGRSNYTKWAAFDNSIDEVTSTRLAEETRYARLIHAELEFLTFPEASLRLGNDFNKLFYGEHNADGKAPPNLREMLERNVLSFEPTVLFLPLGVGSHHQTLLSASRWATAALDWCASSERLSGVPCIGVETTPAHPSCNWYTRTPIPVIVAEYVKYMKATKSAPAGCNSTTR